MRGTKIGENMLNRAGTSSWGTPMWDATDQAAGGVMAGEAQLLYGLVRALRPEVLLEVGTSYGYSTLHLAQACKDNAYGHVHTVEINRERRAAASQNFVDNDVYGYVSTYDKIPELERVDFAFLDAMHTVNALREYLPYCKDAPVIVVHDAGYLDHTRHAMQDDYDIMLFSETSHAGIAICQKR